AARDEPVVDAYLLVDPVGARILQVGPDTRPRRRRAALGHVRLDQHPRPMADDADGLVLVEEAPNERHRVVVASQLIGVRDASRKHERVEIGRVCVADGAVRLDLVAFVEVLPHLDLALLERDQLGLGAGLPDGVERLSQLHLLDAFGEQERHALAIEFVCHRAFTSLPFRTVCPPIKTYPRGWEAKRASVSTGPGREGSRPWRY